MYQEQSLTREVVSIVAAKRLAGDLAVTHETRVRTQRHRGAVIRGMPHDERHLALDLRRVHFKLIVPKAAQPVAAPSLRSASPPCTLQAVATPEGTTSLAWVLSSATAHFRSHPSHLTADVPNR